MLKKIFITVAIALGAVAAFFSVSFQDTDDNRAESPQIDTTSFSLKEGRKQNIETSDYSSELAGQRVVLKPETPQNAVPTIASGNAATRSLRVNVRDPWDRPVIGQIVLAENLDDANVTHGVSIEAVTSVEGVAMLDVPSSSPLRVSVKRKDLTSLPFYEVPAYASVPMGVWEITMALRATKGGRISGRILSAETGELLKEARVSIQSASTRRGETRVGGSSLDTEAGKFDVEVGDGEVMVSAISPLHVTQRKVFSLQPGEWIRDAEILLPSTPGALFRGRVVSREGGAIAKAEASLFYREIVQQESISVPGSYTVTETLRPLGEIRTDKEGAFSFASVPVGDVRLRIQADGFGSTGNIFLTIRPTGEEVEIVLLPTGTLRLRVVAPEGEKLLGELELRSSEQKGCRLQLGPGRCQIKRDRPAFQIIGAQLDEAKTKQMSEFFAKETTGVGEDGFFEVGELPAGDYRLLFLSDVLQGERNISILPGKIVTEEITLEKRRP